MRFKFISSPIIVGDHWYM